MTIVRRELWKRVGVAYISLGIVVFFAFQVTSLAMRMWPSYIVWQMRDLYYWLSLIGIVVIGVLYPRLWLKSVGNSVRRHMHVAGPPLPDGFTARRWLRLGDNHSRLCSI